MSSVPISGFNISPTSRVTSSILRIVASILLCVIVSFAVSFLFPPLSSSSSSFSFSSFDRSLVSFWLSDLPLLSGGGRAFFMTGLLLTAATSKFARPHMGDSPLQAPQLLSYTLPAFFSLEGFMYFLPRSLFHPSFSSSSSSSPCTFYPSTLFVVKVIRALCLLSWVSCIVGFGAHYANITLAITITILHGIVSGCIGTSHRWYVPVYVCICLAFSNSNASFSVDAYLTSYFAPSSSSSSSGSSFVYPFPPADPSSILSSGLGRKLALWCGACTLFYGGVTKMLNAGVKWMDGKSLAYYVSSEENGSSKLLKRLLSQYRSLSLVLSVSSIVLELSALSVLFFPFLRLPLLVSAALFHLGIWLTMWPNYFPQTWCYLIGLTQLDRVHEIAVFAANKMIDAIKSMMETTTTTFDFQFEYDDAQYQDVAREFPLTTETVIAAWVATNFLLFLTFITFFRVEFWPLTGIPMYSFYRYPNFDYQHFHDVKQAVDTASEHINSGYPNALAWSNQWVVLYLSPVSVLDGRSSACNSARVNLKDFAVDRRCRIGVLSKQWRRTLHNVAAADMHELTRDSSSSSSSLSLSSLLSYSGRGADLVRPARLWLLGIRSHLQALSTTQWNRNQNQNRSRSRSQFNRNENEPTPVDRDATATTSENEKADTVFSGFLQLVVKVKGGDLVLSEIPWEEHQEEELKKQK